MRRRVTLSTGTISRWAFRFLPGAVKMLIPGNVSGVYMLFDEDGPAYVGRTSTCLRSRLSRHRYRDRATHFAWEPCRDLWTAFCLEAFWFHRLEEQGGAWNIIHPARPPGETRACPHCGLRALEDVGGLLMMPSLN